MFYSHWDVSIVWVYFYYWNVINVAELLECYVDSVVHCNLGRQTIQAMDFSSWEQGGLGTDNTFTTVDFNQVQSDYQWSQDHY